MKKILFLVVIMLLFQTDSNAFDGNRKGFVLGGGLGVTPYTSWKIEKRNLYGGVINFV